ncbi:hypothetical protein QEN19_003469 [Hanseniaspora menglaensis]
MENKTINSLDLLIGTTLFVTIKPLSEHYIYRKLTGILTASDTSLNLLLDQTIENIHYKGEKTEFERRLGMIAVSFETIDKIEIQSREYKKLAT